MLAPQDYHRYRVLLDGAVRRPDLTVAWADADGQRVLLVVGPPVTPATKLTVLRRLAEREAMATDVLAPYLASGADAERTWVALAGPDGPSLLQLAEWVSELPSLGSRRAALRVVCDLALGLRELLKRPSALPAGGLDDARIGTDGRTLLTHLGELLPGPRLEERELVVELAGWAARLCGDAADEGVARLNAQVQAGELRHLAALADELEAMAEESAGAGHRRVLRWARQLVADHPSIAPPALLDEEPVLNAPRRATPDLPPEEPTGPVLYVDATPMASDAVGYSEAPVASAVTAPNRTPMATPLVAKPRRRPERAPSGANTALAGALVGRKYEVVRRASNGMAGRVYEAVDPDQRLVLVELPNTPDEREEDGASAGESRAAFRDAAEALRRIEHPNVLRLLDYGLDPEPWLALEHTDGQTLGKLLRTVETVPHEDVVTFGRAVCAALAVAHDLGVVHRSLRPSSVLLAGGEWYRAKLVDFGGVASSGAPVETTSDGSWLGATHYLAPEQCRGELGRQESDVYALGVLMYRLLSGRVPFEGKRGVGLLEAHLRAAVPRLPNEVPRPLQHVVLRCLETRPEARYRTAADLDRALSSCQDPTTGPALSALAAAAGHPDDERTEPVIVLPNGVPLPGRWVAPLAAVFVLGLVLAGISLTAGLFFVLSDRGDPTPQAPASLPRVQAPSKPAPRPAAPTEASPTPAPAARPRPASPPPQRAGSDVAEEVAPPDPAPVAPPVPRFTPGPPPDRR